VADVFDTGAHSTRGAFRSESTRIVMSRKRDCLVDAIVKYMNPGVDRIVVPRRLQGVIPLGVTLADLASDLLLKREREGTLDDLRQELKQANPNLEFHAALDRCVG